MQSVEEYCNNSFCPNLPFAPIFYFLFFSSPLLKRNSRDEKGPKKRRLKEIIGEKCVISYIN
jgi:hypothetical protein